MKTTEEIDAIQFALLKEHFNLEEVWEFNLHHRLDVIGLPDWQYGCYVDYKEGDGCWALETDPLSAMVFGIKAWKKHNIKE